MAKIVISPENFVDAILEQQASERQEFEKLIEQHDGFLMKYRVELYNVTPPVLPRLLQLERIISQFIDLLNSGKYNTTRHDIHIKGQSRSMDDFLEWKQRLSNRVISEYNTLLNSISIRANQQARYPNAIPKGNDLDKDERSAADSLFSRKLTQQALALYYWYAQEKKYLPFFPEGKIVAGYEEAVKPYSFSAKTFQIKYNALKTQKARISNVGALLKAIDMLSLFPEAQAMALEELKIANQNT